MSSEDALTDFVGSLSNVPSEVAHLLAEIDHKDKKVTELAQRIARREGEVQKHHKTAGLHTENPKEAESVQKCRADFEKMETLSAEKVALAERLMNTLQRLLPKIQIELARLHGEPVPNIAARFGMVLPPEQLAQPAFSPSPLPSSALVDSTNKRRKLGLESINTSRAHSPAIPSSLSRASPAHPPPPSAVSSAASNRKRKTPAPVEDDEDAEGEEDASGSEDNEGDFMDQDAEAEADVPAGDDQLYCICQKVSYGEMVGCDNQACAYEWFHLPCVGLKEPPKGKWYCPECSSGHSRVPSNPPPAAPSAHSRGRGGRR